MDNKVILTTQNELEEIVAIGAKKALIEYEAERAMKDNRKSFTINQTSKRIHRSFNTVKKYIREGILKTTLDGRVLESEIIRFMDAGE